MGLNDVQFCGRFVCAFGWKLIAHATVGDWEILKKVIARFSGNCLII